MEETLCRYRTDRDGNIVFVDADWCAFALTNGAPEYGVPELLYGRALLSFISEPTTRHIYFVLMHRVLRDRVTIVVPFRCDAPTERRWLAMKMSPYNGGIEFATRVLRTEPRAAPAPLDPSLSANEPMLRICSWCKDVELAPAVWGPVEDAVTRFALFRTADLPLITHGICPSCAALFAQDPRR